MTKIYNKTRKSKIAGNMIVCRSITSKARGLMFRGKSAVKDTVFLFEFNNASRQSLHMFFVWYPIDVLFLDDNMRVVELKKKFLPFTIYSSKEKAKYIIESDSSTIERTMTRKGDVLEW